MKNQKGFIQIPLFIVIIASVLVIGGVGYIGVTQYKNYQTEKVAREKMVQEKEKEVENLKKQITENKRENFQPNTSQTTKPIPAKTPPNLSYDKYKAETTPSIKPISIRYISEDTILEALTVNESGVTQLRYLKPLSKGTQVVFMNEVHIDWSKIMVDNQEGWVSSRVLVNNEPSKTPLSTIIKQWRPIVAYVECDFRDINTNELYSQVRGSGVVIDFGGQITVITNKHVIADKNNYQPFVCRVKLPNDSNTFISQGKDAWADKIIDIGFININNPDEYLKNLTSISVSPLHLCGQNPSLGDNVLILGYPSIGSQTDITATEGIISGFDGNYFITSAKIEHGNSGGVAILVKDNCYLGIPTSAIVGEIESLGRILDINASGWRR